MARPLLEKPLEQAAPAGDWHDRQQLNKQLITRCLLFTISILAASLEGYRHGLSLDTLTMMGTPGLTIFAFLFFFIRSLSSVIRIIRHQIKKRLPKKHLLILFVFPVACLSTSLPRLIGIPNFSEGAAHALRKLDISDQLVAVVAEELSRPRDEYSYGLHETWLRISKTAPFATLKLETPDLRILNDSLLFEFGGPLTLNRWGFAISGIKGKAPSIPPNRFNLRSISQEIVVFEEPTD